MVDLHTHILPHMDDGAASEEISLAMLQAELQQGVSAVCLTPHFYRVRETADEFLLRRSKSYDRLRTAIARADSAVPELLLGAEVTWVPGLARVEGLEQLCIGSTRNFLLELSFGKWERNLPDQIYDLMLRTGLTPILAHLDRYLTPDRKTMIQELVGMGLPVQLGVEPFSRFLSRKQTFSLMDGAACCTIASDCHNTESRAPDIRTALEIIRNKHSQETAEVLAFHSQLLASETFDAL